MKRKREDKRTYWRGVVAEFERSDQTQEAFARSRRLKVCTFRNWVYRVRAERKKRDSSRARLVEVKVADPRNDAGRPLVPSAVVRIRACNGVTLEFNDVPTPSYLAAVVSELPGVEQ
jgi:hypothetical protein